MVYRLLADALLVLNFGFLAFVVCGALLVWRWPRMAWLHVPAVAWGAYVVLAGRVCPLTPLENALRKTGGDSVYAASFIEHYLLPVIYPRAVHGPNGRVLQMGLGVALVLLNAAAYLCAGWCWRRRRPLR